MTNESYISQILEAFSIDNHQLAIPFGSGHINDTFKIATPLQTYILQRINTGVFKDPVGVMQNIAATAKVLRLVPYPLQVLEPIATKQGLPYYKDIQGNFWRLYPYINRAISFDEVPDTAFAYKAAKAFGDFIGGLKDFDAFTLSETIPGFHDGAKRWFDFEKAVVDDLAGRKKGIQVLLDRVFALRQLCFLFEYRYIKGKIHIFTASGEVLPVRAIHHDTKINNVVFDEITGDALCVIDLDTLMPGAVISDFGDMVRTFTPTFDEAETDAGKIAVRLDIFEAMTRGFLSATSGFLTPVERKNLLDGGKYITFIQVIRFLGDYLNGDIYYKTTYREQNLDRAGNQMALLGSILENEMMMQQMIQSG
jgi:hypothetical protein